MVNRNNKLYRKTSKTSRSHRKTSKTSKTLKLRRKTSKTLRSTRKTSKTLKLRRKTSKTLRSTRKIRNNRKTSRTRKKRVLRGGEDDKIPYISAEEEAKLKKKLRINMEEYRQNADWLEEYRQNADLLEYRQNADWLEEYRQNAAWQEYIENMFINFMLEGTKLIVTSLGVDGSKLQNNLNEEDAINIEVAINIIEILVYLQHEINNKQNTDYDSVSQDYVTFINTHMVYMDDIINKTYHKEIIKRSRPPDSDSDNDAMNF
jgi:hypothetical protein